MAASTWSRWSNPESVPSLSPQPRSAVQQGPVRSDCQAGRSQFDGGHAIRLKVFIHHDGAEYWSEIAELPGCFASGSTLSELHEALGEAVGLYLWDEPARVEPEALDVGHVEIAVRRTPRP